MNLENNDYYKIVEESDFQIFYFYWIYYNIIYFSSLLITQPYCHRTFKLISYKLILHVSFFNGIFLSYEIKLK